jgi:hypothetical protein
MLRRKPIRHLTNDLDKSWTADDFLDLVVWYEAAERIFGFQLCYDRYDEPRVVTWTRKGGFSHCKVRTDGDWAQGAGRSPVLQCCDDFPWRTVVREFMTRSPELEPLIRYFIMKQIMTHGPKYSAPSP